MYVITTKENWSDELSTGVIRIFEALPSHEVAEIVGVDGVFDLTYYQRDDDNKKYWPVLRGDLEKTDIGVSISWRDSGWIVRQEGLRFWAYDLNGTARAGHTWFEAVAQLAWTLGA